MYTLGTTTAIEIFLDATFTEGKKKCIHFFMPGFSDCADLMCGQQMESQRSIHVYKMNLSCQKRAS